MDIKYNDKLKQIMAKHKTSIWNDDCENDPDYEDKKQYFDKIFTKRQKQYPLRIGSYSYKRKRK